MFGVSPVRDELNVPVPVPLLVFVVKDMVGFVLVDHTTPLVVTAELPSEVIFPPDMAVVVEMELADIVLTAGRTNDVLVVKMT